MTKSITYKLHVSICLFGEAHSEKYVDRKAGISNPAKSVVPVSDNYLVNIYLMLELLTLRRRYPPVWRRLEQQ